MNLIKNKRKKKKELSFSFSVIYMIFKLVCSVARKLWQIWLYVFVWLNNPKESEKMWSLGEPAVSCVMTNPFMVIFLKRYLNVIAIWVTFYKWNGMEMLVMIPRYDSFEKYTSFD